MTTMLIFAVFVTHIGECVVSFCFYELLSRSFFAENDYPMRPVLALVLAMFTGIASHIGVGTGFIDLMAGDVETMRHYDE